MSEAKIIAVTNRKGGVGKSTITVHIAAGLALCGKRVAIVDTDSQGHSGLMLNMPEENGLHAALIEKKPLAEVVRLVDPVQYAPPIWAPLQIGALYLLPSSSMTYKVPFELREHEQFLFLETLENMIDEFSLDAVLIDTNPTLSLFDGAVYMAADAYIYVTECERMSIDGIQDAITQMQRLSKQRLRFLNRQSQILGVVPNKMRPSTTVHRMNIAAIAEGLPGMVWQPITLRTAWVEAANMQETIYRYAPHGQEARDAWNIVTRTMEALQWQTITKTA